MTLESNLRSTLKTRIYFVLSSNGLPPNDLKIVQGDDLFSILDSISELDAVIWAVGDDLIKDIAKLSPFLTNAVVVIPNASDEAYPTWFVELKMNFNTISTSAFEKELSDLTVQDKLIIPSASDKTQSTRVLYAGTKGPKPKFAPNVPKELLPSDESDDY